MSPSEEQLMLVSGKLISLSQAAKKTPYSAEYLNLLSRKGRLSAIKLNRDWFTTEEAISDYLEKQANKHQDKARFLHSLAARQKNSSMAEKSFGQKLKTKTIRESGFSTLGLLSVLVLGAVVVSGIMAFTSTAGIIGQLAG